MTEDAGTYHKQRPHHLGKSVGVDRVREGQILVERRDILHLDTGDSERCVELRRKDRELYNLTLIALQQKAIAALGAMLKLAKGVWSHVGSKMRY